MAEAHEVSTEEPCRKQKKVDHALIITFIDEESDSIFTVLVLRSEVDPVVYKFLSEGQVGTFDEDEVPKEVFAWYDVVYDAQGSSNPVPTIGHINIDIKIPEGVQVDSHRTFCTFK